METRKQIWGCGEITLEKGREEIQARFQITEIFLSLFYDLCSYFVRVNGSGWIAQAMWYGLPRLCAGWKELFQSIKSYWPEPLKTQILKKFPHPLEAPLSAAPKVPEFCPEVEGKCTFEGNQLPVI